MSPRSSIVFHVNSRRFQVSGRDCLRTLAEFLRREHGLTGTKVVCAEGDCGACTVLCASIHQAVGGRLRYQAVNSCILPLYVLDACHVITVEGLQDGAALHPVQTALVENFAAQCGYCTPGFACAMTALAEEARREGRTAVSEKKARNELTGNLCRCTGYDSILKAAQTVRLDPTRGLAERYHNTERIREFTELSARSVAIESGGVAVFLPASLEKALELRKRLPGLKVVGGATDLGVLVNKGLESPVAILSLQHVAQLRLVRRDGGWAEVGAGVTLSALQPFAEEQAPELGRLLNVFASPQIKNRATMVGNVVNASPVGDLIPFLLVSDADLTLKSADAERAVPLDGFYRGYKRTDLRPEELATAIRFRLPSAGSLTRLYKASRRKDLDISAVAFAARLELEGRVIRSARVAFAGVAPTVVRLKELEEEWTGAEFSRALFELSARRLTSLVSPISDVRGSREFRLKLCRNFLLKFHDDVRAEVAP
ncbi:MAG TPA: xanthine dehydrogenase [Elusimicrobia bacterium]|nr:MAG: hypothetical protein A2X37_00760 [Elusimicrobia bacterium GWA2_66_18]OGR72366.1 MAG: hypothetical protein A2X40_04420 [Elusimicrobia bacterium GWC2_65_9]HAZ08878.1 xanthine dehydrogenase [Elusimicrobiota bacterium]